MQVFFDTIIITLLVVPLVLLFLLFHHLFSRKDSLWHAHRKGAGVLAILLGMFYITISWGSFLEPNLIITKRHTVSIGLDKPIRVVLLADTQTGPYKRSFFVERVVKKVLKTKPDIVFFAGDFVMNDFGSVKKESSMLEPFKKIADHIPFYGVLGNHEYGFGEPSLSIRTVDVHKEVESKLKEIGIDMLNDDERVISVDGQQIRIVGLDDLWGSNFVIKDIKKSSMPTIAMTHNPDVVYHLDSEAVDLLLTGHTHGGQIRLPIIGSLVNANTRLPTKYYKGFSLIHGVRLFVTGGLGESGPRARLFNIPEISVLDLN